MIMGGKVEKMSFSHEVKTELSKHISSARHCQLAELAAIMSFAGQYGKVGEGQYMVGFQTENEDVVRKGFTLLKKTYNIEEDAAVSEQQMQDLYCKFGDLEGITDSVLIKNTCCQRAFLRGAFLCVGSMSAPEKGYHLEFVCSTQNKAKQLQDENGNDVNFEHLMTVEHEGSYYIVLEATEDTDDCKEGEAIILKIIQDEESGEDVYATIEDEAEFNAVFDKCMAIMDEEDEAAAAELDLLDGEEDEE